MNKSIIIAKYTFIEVYRSKIMLGLFFMAIAVLIVTYIASEFAYGAPGKIALDFGIGIMSLSNLVVAIFLGATLLSREIETKTLYMIISRPISRSSFLIGKILGLSTVLILNTLFLGVISSIIFYFLGGVLNIMIFYTCLFSLLESLQIMTFAVLFSLITNISMSVMFTIIILILGHNIGETINNFFAKSNLVLSKILLVASYIIPDLERINTKDFLIYQQNLPTSYLVSSFSYGTIYLVSLLVLISFIFNKKNLD